MPVIENKIKTGEAFHVGTTKITPVARVLKIQLPGHHAGLIWNRPRAIVVETADGQENTLPVIDVTRLAVWALLGAGLIGAIVIGLFFRQK
jgi:hypothetical protein